MERRMNSGTLTRQQLDVAFKSCACSGDLDTALRFPALAIALKNVAENIAAPRPTKPIRIDFKRATAGDFDD